MVILIKIYDFYSKSVHRRLLEREISRTHVTGIVLDIGSKNRRYDHLFPDTTIIAIDIDPKSKNDNILICDARYLCFKDNTFDTIISFEVLEYIHEINVVFSEILRVLKKGHCAYISIPFLNPIHGDGKDVIRYTKYGLDTILRRQFENFDIVGFGGKHTLCFDLMFYNARESNIVFKTFMYIPLVLIDKLCRYLDEKENSDRFVMGYFIKVIK
jgi:SAM-dependent methyltransferase